MPVDPVSCGKENAFDIADSTAEHGSDEERGGEHATGSSADERDSGGNNLENSEEGENFPGVLPVHGLVHGAVARAHDLRKAEKGNESDEQSGERGLKVLRPARQSFEAWTQIANRFSERDRGETADNPEDSVGKEFTGAL